jgi:hypothetical protein
VLPRELTTNKTSPLSQPIVAIKNKQFFLLLSLPSNNLETDHKENTSRAVYRVFPSTLEEAMDLSQDRLILELEDTVNTM